MPDTAHLSGITLPIATIRDARFERTGYAIWRGDSLPLNAPMSLSERLLWENALDVRANAPGTLATLSVRGAGPNRSPLIWNGLNLQSPMNGVVDAALLPLWPDDQLEIQFGGQSAAQSSGAMGGSVVVTQGQQRFGQGFSGALGAAFGSFGRLESNLEAAYSTHQLATKVRAAWQQAHNDYYYRKQGLDGQFYKTKQVNNFSEKLDLQQFNQLKINDKNALKSAFWFQKANRELPPPTTESPRETWQKDQAARAVLHWDHAPNKHSVWTTRIAWLEDQLYFYRTGDTDTSRSRQLLLSTERSTTFGKQWAWRMGAQALRQWAQVDGYADSTRWYGQTRLAGFSMTEWKKGAVRLSAMLRQEWAQAQAAPFTASIGGQIGLGRVGDVRFHGSRNFNLPTLNDRYWKNLGDTALRPEKGYSADAGWIYKGSALGFELTGFHLMMNDWILWQPDSTGIFRPGNLRKVWSRGWEANAHWHCLSGNAGASMPGSKNRWTLDLSGQVQWSRTTNAAVYGGSASVLGEQLPYTPRASGAVAVKASLGRFSWAYMHQFRGKRLDNAGKTLQAFQTGNVLASISLLKRRISVDVRVENIWNLQYEIIRYRPMPGRSWRLGLVYRV